ncbi:MAG: U32 family peptidase, partial [Clostridia bacterium]|nr:U32 family peptidase [Clostridia bacterium]
MDIIFDTGMNVFNSYSAKVATSLGACKILLSNELTLKEAENIKSTVPKGTVGYGKIPLMVFKNCPVKNGINCNSCNRKNTLTDRKGTQFPVRCRIGFSEMLNSVPVWLADKQSDLASLDFTLLYFTDESKEKVSEVIKAYQNGTESKEPYTRGLFYRGVI